MVKSFSLVPFSSCGGCLIVSVVQECFTKNDIILENQPHFLAGEYISHNCTTLVFVPHSDHWRNLRHITTIEVFSTHCLNKFMEMRRDEIKWLAQKPAQVSHKEFAKVEMRSCFSELTFNTIMRMILGKRYWEENCEVGLLEESRKLQEIVKEMVTLGGINNLADFLPILRLFDYGNLEKRLKSLAKRTDGFLQGLNNKHRNAKAECKYYDRSFESPRITA